MKPALLGRVAGSVQLAGGAVLLLRTGPVLAALAESPANRPPRWLARVLAGRSIAQGLALLARPERSWLVGGAAVDATHATSMLPVLASRRYRRVAAISAGSALVLAAVEWLAARTDGGVS